MDNTSILDTNNMLIDRIKDMSNKDKMEAILNLCDIVLEECPNGEFRGGIRPDNISVNQDLEVVLGVGGANDRANWTPEELEAMSPEQFWNGTLDNKTDIYSIGLLMYYCITGGKLPLQPDKEGLDANDHAEILRRRMSGEEFEMPESAGEKLGSIIKKATAFRAEDRYQGILELQDDICECLEEIKSIPVPDSEIIFNKSEDELTDAERMMLGIIGKSAADEALYNSGVIDIPSKQESEETIEVAQEETVLEEQTEETVEEPVEEVSDDDVIEQAEETVEVAEVEENIEESEPANEETANEEKSETVEAEAVAEAEEVPVEAEERNEEVKAEAPAEEVKEEKPKPKKKEARTTATPVVQYNTQDKKKKKQKKRNAGRTAFVSLLLCVAIIVGALVINSIGNGDKMVIENTPKPEGSAVIDNTLESEKPEQSPEVSEPVESAEPTLTPTPEVKVSTYEVILSDKSWTQAEADAESKGGHLVVINDQDEFDKVVALAVSKGARFVWLGCQRDASGQLKWVNGDSVDFYKWAANEPSVTDRDGTAENYVLLWNSKANLSGNWEYNDVGNDPVSIYPKGYSGKICYVIEYEK